ncbi:MAG: sodium:solute symporter [Planctomycetota bacterium]|nr:sodium:solute symporter [Planctomycetota bacterium]
MGFQALDWIVFAGYLGMVMAVGSWFSRRQVSTSEYFTAGKHVHWLPVSISILATLFSGISFLGHPARVYRYNSAMIAWPFAVLAITPIVIYVLLPFYRRLDVTTAYEYLEKRFGLNVRLLASALFIGKRLFWMALVALAPSLALSAIVGLPVTWCILIIGVVATLYTGLGGMHAVIWTDATQFVVLMLGQCLIIAVVAARLDGGLGEIWSVGVADHKAWASLEWDLTASTFWTFLLAGMVLSLSDLGADQVTVQRLMCTTDERSAAKALWFNAFFKFPAMVILLGMGVALWVFYKTYPERLPLEPADYDKIVPYFTVHELPTGVSGLVIAAVFAAAMSSFDSGLNSLSATLTVDWYERLGRTASERKSLFVAKCLTYVIGAAVTLTALVVYWAGVMSIIDASNKYLGFFGGALLAMFLLGALTRRAKALPTVLGALCGVALVFLIDMAQDPASGNVVVHTYLYGAISCLVTLGVGFFGSLIGPPPSEQHIAGLTVASLSAIDAGGDVDCDPRRDDINH